MKNLSAAIAATLLVVSVPALADFRNGPNPYEDGFGFDEPDEAGAATWGGWSRGDAGTIHVEFDSFAETEFGSRTSNPDVAESGADASISWNQNTFVTGSQNLYSFSVAPDFDLTLTPDMALTDPVSVALQIETWGVQLDPNSVVLNGIAPELSAVTYQDPAYDSPFGIVLLEHLLFTWTFDSLSDIVFDFTAIGSSLSLTQVAIDIGPGSPAVVPVPAAAWLLGSGLLGLGAVRRRRRAAA
ncbi:MAG: VPLPA-CTERM sorting domain-containing protein [Pseudomonadota bacterium]